MSTTPNPVEQTGVIVLRWGPDGPTVHAPNKAAIPVDELFDLPRVPGEARAVQLPGGVRYLIGDRHKRWPGAVYLHKLP